VLLLFTPTISVSTASRSITRQPEIDAEDYLRTWAFSGEIDLG
jgi:hypothetical protein